MTQKKDLTVAQTSPTPRTRALPTGFGLIVLAFIAFISLGLPDGLLGIAWPSMRADFAQPLDALGLLLFSAMLGYISSSFLGGQLMARLGVGRLLAASCFITSLSLLGYTLAPVWPMVVVLGIGAGFGGGAIDAGLNTYIAANHGEGLMQWLHAFFGVGITTGPVIMTFGLNTFEQWRVGYWIVGGAQLILALSFLLTARMWTKGQRNAGDQPSLTDYKTPITATLRQRGAWLSAALFFIYVGVELMLGHWGYTLLTESRGVAPEAAGLWVSAYWGAFTVGRVLAGLYAARVGVRRLLTISLGLAGVGAVMVALDLSEEATLTGMMLVGFAIAPIFAGMVSDTPNRVPPEHAANTIGFQISAAGVGVAIVPSIGGLLANRVGLETVPLYLIGLIVMMTVLYTLSHRRA
jgi:fucose permease